VKAAGVHETFRVEAEDTLAALEQSLHELDAGQAGGDVIHTIFRAAHTLKGAALVVGRQDVAELAHVVEELFARWRDGRLQPTPSQTRWSLEAVEMLQEQLRGESSETRLATDAAGSGSQHGQPTLRVAHSDVDALLTLVGELVRTHGQMSANVARLAQAQRRDLYDALDEYALLHASLREHVMKLRLVALTPLLSRLRRTAHDVARSLGKEVDLVVEGGEQLLDASIVEGLRDPFMHLVRNAVDHGVEPAAARVARGKSPRGQLRLRIQKAAGAVVCSFGDDGQGLDRERIARKARERGRNVDAELLTSQDLEAFIFEPGFSTAERITEVSGRGVGMDVVRKNIEALRGTIHVRSEPGEGTTFTISVPLDITILDCAVIEAGRQHFIVPHERVLEFVGMAVPGTAALTTLQVRGRTLPCVRLAAILGERSVAQQQTILVMSHAAGQVGLVVDYSHGTQQLVVRSVGPLLRSLPIVAGAAVLGTGDIALLLDIDKVIEASTRRPVPEVSHTGLNGVTPC
jgi:two-component system, chemotaxis family, sensor kinase CheA